MDKNTTIESTGLFGTVLAAILSFQLNHSVLYMVLHGLCGWLYVAFRVWKGNY